MTTTEPDEFASYPQPEWNRPGCVAAALHGVAAAHDEMSSLDAYHELFSSVGNDHAGTHYPVVLAVMPHLGELLRTGTEWSRRTVIDTLFTLYFGFQPELGHETFRGVSLADAVRAQILALRTSVEATAEGSGPDAESAKELLESLDEVD